MAEELAQVPTPTLPKGQGRIGFKEAMGIQEPYLKRKAELQPQISKAEGDIAQAQQAQKEQLAFGKSMAQEQYGVEQAAAQKAYQEKLEKEPLPAFVPTKDTAQDIAGLFGLIGVIGMLVGGEGKMAGMRAMGAMDGMLKGYREGRADLYKKERNEFEANFKTMLKKHEEFRKEMEDAIKLAATNKEAGYAAAELAATKAGSDIVKAQLRKGDLLGAYKLVDESQKGAQEALKLESSAREAEARAREARAKAESERQFRLQMFQAKQAQPGAAKPPPKEIVAQNQLRNNLIPKIEEALPVLDRLNQEGKWNTMTALLAVDPRAAEMQFKDDPEALNLILTLAYFRSKEFETAGKALTRKEDQILAPIVRGDLRAYEGIKNAMESGLKTLKTEQKGLEATYPFIKNYNEAMRGETEEAAPPAPSGKPMPTGDKLKAYADQHFGGDEKAAQDYLKTQGYQ